MFNFYGAARRLKKQLAAATRERDSWQKRAEALQKRLDERSDFFIEREMKLVDRFLTSQVKTYAITDEIRAAAPKVVEDDALDVFLAEKREFLVSCAKEAGIDRPEDAANTTFNQNYSAYVLEFQAQ